MNEPKNATTNHGITVQHAHTYLRALLRDHRHGRTTDIAGAHATNLQLISHLASLAAVIFSLCVNIMKMVRFFLRQAVMRSSLSFMSPCSYLRLKMYDRTEDVRTVGRSTYSYKYILTRMYPWYIPSTDRQYVPSVADSERTLRTFYRFYGNGRRVTSSPVTEPFSNSWHFLCAVFVSSRKF